MSEIEMVMVDGGFIATAVAVVGAITGAALTGYTLGYGVGFMRGTINYEKFFTSY